ncbi:MAG: 30S ribosomal protein S18 [Bacteroidetes bacterium]|nr:30S ribosomal protein S18 [Bacteroidota bacterium]
MSNIIHAQNPGQGEVRYLVPIVIEDKKQKFCRFKKFRLLHVDYKNPEFLTQFLNEQGKILPRRITGNSLKFQKKVQVAIKRARQIALLPYETDLLK